MKWMRILLLACAVPVHAEIKTIDTLGVEAQERPMWCWAAVSVMGIKSFKEQGDFHHLTQVQVVARRELGLEKLAQVNSAAVKTAIAAQEAQCSQPDQCDSGEAPLLFDIDSDFPDAGFALSMKALAMDIGERRHPVIIRWSYTALRDDARSGNHALIITGYNDDDPTQPKVRVFDPLPVGSSMLSKHEKWIPFATYLSPGVHEGAKVRAIHRRDQYRMRRGADDRPPAEDEYPKVSVPAMPVPDAPPGGFEPLQVLDPAIKQYMSRQVFLKSDGRPRKGALVSGKAIPVVTFGADELLRAGAHPENLLVRRTATYVVPVLEGKSVVDSFLLLKEPSGRWVEGGYSNNEIASLASKIRDQHAGDRADAADFYIVSIPELAAYFVAHGFQQQAKLDSLEYDGRGGFIPASQALAPVVHRARDVVKQKPGGISRKPSTPTPAH